jgi:hypothetical protein
LPEALNAISWFDLTDNQYVNKSLSNSDSVDDGDYANYIEHIIRSNIEFYATISTHVWNETILLGIIINNTITK